MPDSPVVSEQETGAPDGLVAGLQAFTAEHQGATAVIEHVGRRGARIVLVGQDGTWGDRAAPATDVARAACQAAGVPIENGWARELAESMPDDEPDHWHAMGRTTAAR